MSLGKFQNHKNFKFLNDPTSSRISTIKAKIIKQVFPALTAHLVFKKKNIAQQNTSPYSPHQN